MEPVPRYKKLLLGLSIIVGIFAIGIGAGFAIEKVQSNKQTATAIEAPKQEEVIPPSTVSQLSATNNNLSGITLTFTGDITLNGSMKTLVKTKLDGDYQKLFGAAKALIEKADIAYGNFNGTLGIGDSNKTEFAAMKGLQNTGFDVLSTSYAGSNRSVKNLIETMLSIDGNGLLRTGTGWSYENARQPRLINVDGETIGYLAFSDNKTDWPKAEGESDGILSANDPQIEEIISEARAKSDILVVAFNWGASTKEHSLRQEELARTAIHAGASIVVGHNGSNLQDIEYYHGGLIAYNLGSLLKGSGNKTSGINGLILETNIDNGVINNIRTYGVTEHKSGYIDSVNEISAESLIRDKGVINQNIDHSVIENSLPSSVTSQIVTRGPKINKVAITIDDAWNPATVKRALDVLSVKNAKATIFPVGATADANKLNLIRAVTNGIELGNHTDTHGWLTQMSEAQIEKEIDNWQIKIDAAIDRHYETVWFRPPFMAGFSGRTKTAEVTTKIAKEKGMRIALWNVDPYFAIGQKADAQAISNYIVSHAAQGSVIILHFTPEHIAALPSIIDGLRAKGLEPVTLSELVSGN
jgi:peptidoglycan/xylan/chitin deacetylase (PgdA/CDA1 family)